MQGAQLCALILDHLAACVATKWHLLVDSAAFLFMFKDWIGFGLPTEQWRMLQA